VVGVGAASCAALAAGAFGGIVLSAQARAVVQLAANELPFGEGGWARGRGGCGDYGWPHNEISSGFMVRGKERAWAKGGGTARADACLPLALCSVSSSLPGFPPELPS
jgi:hypothetical protein